MFCAQSEIMSGPSEEIVHTVTVRDADAGKRLDRLLADALPELSRMRIKALIEAGQAGNGAGTIMEPSYRVKPGQTWRLTVPPAADAEPQAQAMPLRIVYEDAALIVIDKPAGLVVHPAPGNPDRTLVNALLAHCGGSLSGIGGVKRPGIVHRLDKDTSGLLVAAKTDRAHAGLSDLFSRHDIERVYRAVVWGVPVPAAGEIEGAIGRDPRNRKKMAVVTRGGKPALTRYNVERRFGNTAALLACRLETGRTHQIRVHLAAIGHPVMGDPIYGRARRKRHAMLPPHLTHIMASFGRQALHASVLGFRHPVSGAALRFESPLPADMGALVDALDALE